MFKKILGLLSFSSILLMCACSSAMDGSYYNSGVYMDDYQEEYNEIIEFVNNFKMLGYSRPLGFNSADSRLVHCFKDESFVIIFEVCADLHPCFCKDL